MTLRQLIDKLDPYFENPFVALHGQKYYQLAEWVSEYQRVFGDKWALHMDADWAACCSISWA